MARPKLPDADKLVPITTNLTRFVLTAVEREAQRQGSTPAEVVRGIVEGVVAHAIERRASRNTKVQNG